MEPPAKAQTSEKAVKFWGEMLDCDNRREARRKNTRRQGPVGRNFTLLSQNIVSPSTPDPSSKATKSCRVMAQTARSTNFTPFERDQQASRAIPTCPVPSTPNPPSSPQEPFPSNKVLPHKAYETASNTTRSRNTHNLQRNLA